MMMWTVPDPNVRRSSSLGWRTPFGWEWTLPSDETSFGIMLVFTVALTLLEVVPGITRTSVITRPSSRRPSRSASVPRNRPMYSSG